MIGFFFLLLPITQSNIWQMSTKGSESYKVVSKITRMPMGKKEGCDDGKRNLELDLGDMEEATTCYTGVDARF